MNGVHENSICFYRKKIFQPDPSILKFIVADMSWLSVILLFLIGKFNAFNRNVAIHGSLNYFDKNCQVSSTYETKAIFKMFERVPPNYRKEKFLALPFYKKVLGFAFQFST